jgi:hypothetical protein
MDRERIVRKIEYLQNEIEAVRGLLDGWPAGRVDPLTVRGRRYSLQASAEVIIDACYHDVCYHVSAKARHHVPHGAHAALAAAVRGSEIDRRQIQRWRSWQGSGHPPDERSAGGADRGCLPAKDGTARRLGTASRRS